MYGEVICHHGIRGQKWGVRRYQNEDGSLTPAGERRYMNSDGSVNYKNLTKDAQEALDKNELRAAKNRAKIYGHEDYIKSYEKIKKRADKRGNAKRAERFMKFMERDKTKISELKNENAKLNEEMQAVENLLKKYSNIKIKYTKSFFNAATGAGTSDGAILSTTYNKSHVYVDNAENRQKYDKSRYTDKKQKDDLTKTWYYVY